jgi:hypothetical protein
MWKFLKSNRTESSFRVWGTWITAPVGAILWAVVFHIVWMTLHPYEIFMLGNPPVPTLIKNEIPWLSLVAFIGGIITALISLWYGKKINKDAEITQGTKETDTSNPQ